LAQRLLWPAWAGTAAVVLAVAVGARGLAPLLAFGLGGFAPGPAARQIVLATRRQGWRGFVGRTNGGMGSHLAIARGAVGRAASGRYTVGRERPMQAGATAVVAAHELDDLGPRTAEEPNKVSVRARVAVDGDVYEPAINRFTGRQMSVGTPSVKTGLLEDVYLTLQQAPAEDEGRTAAIRVIVQPMVTWLWIGGVVMLAGTVLALFPGRRRRQVDPVSAPVPTGDERPEPDGD